MPSHQPSSQTAHTPSNARSFRTILILSLLLLGGAEFVWRGPVPAARTSNDLSVIYAAARCWVTGRNPYDLDQLGDALEELEYRGPASQSLEMRRAVYPPSTYVCMAPFAWLSWPAMRILWLIINLATLAMIAFLALRIGWPNRPYGQFDWRSTPTAAVVVCLLAAAPIHTSIAKGQLALLTTLLMIASLHQAMGKRVVAAGWYAAVALALKPQLGIIMAVFFLIRGRWRSALICWLGAGLILAVGAGILQWQNPAWFQDWLRNLHLFNHGGFGDMTDKSPLAIQMVSIHYLLHKFIESRIAVHAMAVGLGAAVTGLSIYLGWGRHRRLDDLLIAAILTVACLLCSSHRFYDATALVLVLMWALATIIEPHAPDAGSRRVPAMVTLGWLAIFLVPGSAIILEWTGKWIPATLTQTSWWDLLIAPHQTWTLLALLGALLVALSRPRSQAGD